MEAGQASDFSESIEVERLIQMVANVGAQAFDAIMITVGTSALV